MNEERTLYGVAGSFASPERFLRVLRELRASGYARVEANSPFAVEGMSELIGGGRTPIAAIVLAAGVLGATGGYLLQWYATRDFPLNAGGRPIHSWPAYIPVTFELTVLTAAIVGVLGLLALARLPKLHHPLFGIPGFERASQDRFFVCLRADDPKFDRGAIRALFDSLGAETVTEVYE